MPTAGQIHRPCRLNQVRDRAQGCGGRADIQLDAWAVGIDDRPLEGMQFQAKKNNVKLGRKCENLRNG